MNNLHLPVSPDLLLLGIHDDTQRSHHLKLLISYLLYYAKKEILLKWTLAESPMMASLEAMLDALLRMFKLTYMNGECPWKYDKVRLPWTPN